jgi:hypothetical protein
MNPKARSIINPVINEVVWGALAGGVAAWVMQQVTRTIYAHESEQVKAREKAARRNELPHGPVVEQEALSGISGGGAVAVEKAAGFLGKPLSSAERQKLAFGVQYGLSMSAGMTYALVRHHAPAIAWGHGLAFGVLFWLAADEVGNTLLGLTPPPDAFPGQTHARGLAGHLAFGLVLETILEITVGASAQDDLRV